MGDVILKRKEKRVHKRLIYSIVMMITTLLVVIGTFSGSFYLYNEALGNYGNLRMLFGYKPMVVISGSMLPTIQVNSLNLCKAATYDDIEIGDIVVYREITGIYITHRAIEKTTIAGEDVLITKGDNNKVEDAPVKRGQVVGKIVKTWNGVAPVLSDILPKYGNTDSISSIRVALVIILTMSVISTVLFEMNDRVRAFIFRDRIKVRYKKELIESEKRVNELLDKIEIQKDKVDSIDDVMRLNKEMKILKEINSLIESMPKEKK